MNEAKRLIVLLGLAAVAGCGGSETQKAEEPVAVVVQPPPGESKCDGNRVPPTGYRQETAFAPADGPNAAEAAKQSAVSQLRDKICQGYRCGEIEAKIVLWNTERDASQVCAMAVLKAQDVAAFEKAPREELKRALEKAASDLVKATGKGAPVIAIDNVRDNGVDGGARAEWLIDRMAAALSKAGGAVAKIPQDWSGLMPPKGSDGVLRGRITRMHGRESVLEVTWILDLGAFEKSVDPVAFPEFVGPVIDASTELADLGANNADVSLRFPARPGGGLCNGQHFEMHLETRRALHVRVIDLYGKNEGLVVWASKDVVAPGKTLSLGNFQAIAGEVPAERFLVIAAPTKEKLGKYADVPEPCRIPQDAATALSLGNGVPLGSVTASRSYRIVSDDCGDIPAPPHGTDVIADLPMCW